MQKLVKVIRSSNTAVKPVKSNCSQYYVLKPLFYQNNLMVVLKSGKLLRIILFGALTNIFLNDSRANRGKPT